MNTQHWIKDRTVYYTRHGSHAYGTNIASSDEDFKGVAVPPASCYNGFLHRFEQAESKNPDSVIYDIRKFFHLAADCNPSIIEVLFTDESDVIVPNSQLRDIAPKFLSKKAKHTFSGYAMSQLKRIKTHYRWLKTPPKSAPTRGEFGLPERTVIPADQLAAAQSAINKKLEKWNLDGQDDLDPAARILIQNKMAEVLAEIQVSTDSQWMGAARTLGIDSNFIELLDRERQYTSRKREFAQYVNWHKTRNPARAEIEAKFGYDTKHAMHLVRLMTMCGEILRGDGVKVKRDDRDFLLSIRNGAWDYDLLVAWAEESDRQMDQCYIDSPLPNAPDRELLDSVCCSIVEDMQ